MVEKIRDGGKDIFVRRICVKHLSETTVGMKIPDGVQVMNRGTF